VGDVFQDKPANGDYCDQMLETDSTFKNILVTPDAYSAGWPTYSVSSHLKIFLA
jgi:hypothetical protein